MKSTLSIEQTQNRGLKQSAKEWAGWIAAIVAANRTKQLRDSPTSKPTNLQDKLIMDFLKRHAMLNKHADFFERLHIDFWQGEGGIEFSQNCDHRFEDLFLAKQKIEFDQLREVWNQLRPKHIIEFGCNSGLLLNYLTTQLEGVQSSTGIEINAQQVQQNQASDSFDPRIQFTATEGGEWLFENATANSLYVSNGGVLEYFKRERLDEMLTHITAQLRPAVFFASEPVADDHDWTLSTESIPFGEELSFSHNYTDLFESNGFSIVHQRAVQFATWKMVATIATCR